MSSISWTEYGWDLTQNLAFLETFLVMVGRAVSQQDTRQESDEEEDSDLVVVVVLQVRTGLAPGLNRLVKKSLKERNPQFGAAGSCR